MSSEMREMLIEVLDAIDHPDHGDGISRATYDKARALLARTEAGADGEKGVNNPEWPLLDRVEFALRDAGFDYDEAFRIAHLAAHPQGASGDAGFSAAELEALAKCVTASVSPGGCYIPQGWNVLLDKIAAMQAKEAK